MFFDHLEIRSLLSAPVLSNLFADSGLRNYIAIDAPATLNAHADAAVGVHAVTFFLDRNGNGLWDKGTDLDFGAQIQAANPTSADFQVPITPTPDWGFDPFQRIFAAGVSATGEWSTPVQINFFATYPRPFIETATASVFGQQVENGFFYTTTIKANAYTPNSGPNTYIGGITFFVDNDLNGVWTPGVDRDLGASRTADAAGYYTITYQSGSTRPGRICAAAFSSVLYPYSTGAFGPVAIAAEYSGSAVAELPSTINLSGRLGIATDRTGDPMRLSVVASSPSSPLGALTLFHDANADGLWTPGLDTDLGAFSFAAPFRVYRAQGQVEFTLTPAMGTGLQHFVMAVRTDETGYPSQWGPTRTFVINIVGQPQVSDISFSTPTTPAAGIVTADFTVRDDYAVRDVLAFIDRNNNGAFDTGEGVAQNGAYVQLTPGYTSARWRVSIDLASLNYTPGTYHLLITAFDFNDVPSTSPASADVVLV